MLGGVRIDRRLWSRIGDVVLRRVVLRRIDVSPLLVDIDALLVDISPLLVDIDALLVDIDPLLVDIEDVLRGIDVVPL